MSGAATNGAAIAVDVERRTEVVIGAGEVACGAPCQRTHVVEVGLSWVEARPHVIIGERTGDIGLEKPRRCAVHIGGREGRIEGDRGAKIRQRAVEIGLHMPQFPAHAIVGCIFRVEADRGVAIGDRMARIAFVLPYGRAPCVDQRPSGIKLERGPVGRKRFSALAGVRLRRFAAGRSFVFTGCHEIAVLRPVASA